METHSRQQFCTSAAEFLMEKIQAAQRGHGTCTIGLSGGKTPRAVYEKLGTFLYPLSLTLPPRGRELLFFLIDERYVPADHLESNQRMVRETLLKNLPLHEKNLTFPDTTIPIDACVADYAQRLQELWEDRPPDLVILGMGTDGHIASLFPPLSDVALGEEHLVLHTRAPEGIGPESARDRISLSLPALCTVKEHVLLLQGKEKQRTWEEMLSPLSCRRGRGAGGEGRWPLKRIMETGKLTVFMEWS